MRVIGGGDGVSHGLVQSVVECQIAVTEGRIARCPVHVSDELVVSAPEADACMVSEAFHLVGDFVMDILQEVFVIGIDGAGEHIVVPEEDSQAVACLVECVLLELSSAPDPQHIHVGGLRAGEKLPIVFGGVALRHCVAGNPVCALCEDLDPVDLEDHAEADFVLLVDHLQFLEADLLGDCLAVAGDLKRIERLFAISVGPPKIWIPHSELC